MLLFGLGLKDKIVSMENWLNSFVISHNDVLFKCLVVSEYNLTFAEKYAKFEFDNDHIQPSPPCLYFHCFT